MYEVFYPFSGIAVYRTRIKWYAMLLARWYGMDYAKEGEGWLADDKGW